MILEVCSTPSSSTRLTSGLSRLRCYSLILKSHELLVFPYSLSLERTFDLTSVWCASNQVPNIVVDPVMVSSSGSRLMSLKDVDGIRSLLFPLATVVTPNLEEAKVLLHSEAPITTVEHMEDVAKKIFAMGPANVLIKGGHLLAASYFGGTGSGSGRAMLEDHVDPTTLTDVLYDGMRFHHITTPVVNTTNVHGTGCTLASAIAANLALGYDVLTAVRKARSYLYSTLERSRSLKVGGGRHGPMYHMGTLLPRVFSPPLPSSWARGLHFGRSGGSNKGYGGTIVSKGFIDLSVYAITDSSAAAQFERTMEASVVAAIEGGATVIQLREKNLSTRDMLSLAQRLHAITKVANVPLIINDRIDVALAVDAEGVHVGQSDMPTKLARRLVGPDRILGVSVKSLEQAAEAEQGGADYLGVGAVYPTNTKVETKLVGLETLRLVTSASTLPVVAIGGIEPGTKTIQAIRHGASGVAVIKAIFGASDIKAATEALVQDVTNARRSLL